MQAWGQGFDPLKLHMKQYPSINASTGQNFREFQAHVFDKIDGSNLRFEWSKKQGWYKFGTRHRLFDTTDPVFGSAISIWTRDWAEAMTKVARDNRWESVIAFAEFHGSNSLGGIHDPTDEHKLTLFDVAPYKKGILGPKEFLDLFGTMAIPRYFGKLNWTRDFVAKVRAGEVEGVTLEGVVGKTGSGHDLYMAKAKTQIWIDKILARYGQDEGQKIISS